MKFSNTATEKEILASCSVRHVLLMRFPLYLTPHALREVRETPRYDELF